MLFNLLLERCLCGISWRVQITNPSCHQIIVALSGRIESIWFISRCCVPWILDMLCLTAKAVYIWPPPPKRVSLLFGGIGWCWCLFLVFIFIFTYESSTFNNITRTFCQGWGRTSRPPRRIRRIQDGWWLLFLLSIYSRNSTLVVSILCPDE